MMTIITGLCISWIGNQVQPTDGQERGRPLIKALKDDLELSRSDLVTARRELDALPQKLEMHGKDGTKLKLSLFAFAAGVSILSLWLLINRRLRQKEQQQSQSVESVDVRRGVARLTFATGISLVLAAIISYGWSSLHEHLSDQLEKAELELLLLRLPEVIQEKEQRINLLERGGQTKESAMEKNR